MVSLLVSSAQYISPTIFVNPCQPRLEGDHRQVLFCAGAALTKIYSLITWIADWRRWVVLLLICLDLAKASWLALPRIIEMDNTSLGLL